MNARLPEPGHSATVLLDGPAGALETQLARPTTPERGIAVACHPHPLGGGAMGNKVVYALHSAAAKAGLATARFNFRSVGRSAGAHDNGVGEVDDALAVIAWLRAQLAAQPLLLMGFSFGGYVALAAAARAEPRALVTIAPPFRYFETLPRPPAPRCPWLVVHGTDDEIVAHADTLALLPEFGPRAELVSPDGTGHFFHGKLGEIDAAVAAFLQRHWR